MKEKLQEKGPKFERVGNRTNEPNRGISQRFTGEELKNGQKRQSEHSQERFNLFVAILLHLQQPAVAPLPQEGGGVGISDALRAHVDFDVRRTDGAAELCGGHVWSETGRKRAPTITAAPMAGRV